MERIMIVDGDENINVHLKKFLKKKEFDVCTTSSGSEAIASLKGKSVDLVICDFKLSDQSGIDLLQKVKVIDPLIQVIICTSYSNIRVAVDAVKKGAFDYVTKPLFPDELLLTIRDALAKSKRQPGRRNGTRIGKKQTEDQYIIAPSYQSQLVQKHINLIAPTNMSVIICGETGTGKEYVARSIHERSDRRHQPFVPIDCGAIPNELAASELFGHVKGAYTGAIAGKKGCFERANGGTLFLDEIGNLSYDNQMQLLRVLQEKVVRRVGGTTEVPVDIRLLVATNEDLKTAVKSGDFREDVFYRLNEFKIELVPLRERPQDTEVFAAYFLKMANQQLNKNVEGFQVSTLRKLISYHWHGNLRELKNVVKRAVLICECSLVDDPCLPVEISHTEVDKDFCGDVLLNSDVQISLKEVAERAERGAILEVLRKTDFNKTKTAELLQVDRKTLYNKLAAYNIDTEMRGN
ncbi:MAG: sigma-54 dependent transcriptional regulator [Imperialibacter sp.]|uniref:sigma-54-dependent transcriptional regulator n=1 Tax=Imperialibacter sp. TaxID=2038411 RepID=UPI0032EB7D3E